LRGIATKPPPERVYRNCTKRTREDLGAADRVSSDFANEWRETVKARG
jgi:hypothetical protein